MLTVLSELTTVYVTDNMHVFDLQEGKDELPLDKNGQLIFSNVDYVDTWKAMEECVELGLTKSIGLSNFNSEQIQRVLDVATIRPVVNQVEVQVLNTAVPDCREQWNQISLCAASSGPLVSTLN